MTYPPIPSSRVVAATTAGIARQMNPDPKAAPSSGQGGGDLNGTAASVIMLGQAGTAAGSLAVPRRPSAAGVNMGIAT